MTITFTNTQKIKATRKAKRDADIAFNLTGRTRSAVYKNKKAYDRKRDKKVVF